MNSIVKSCLSITAFMGTMIGIEVGSAQAMAVGCPTSLTATWIQAANGRTNTITGTSSRLSGPLPPPTTRLSCVLDNVTATSRITQVVQLQPGSVPSACGAKATFTGRAITIGGVPPFGGFIFKSDRITATPTYNEATGRCQLDIFLRPTITSLQMSQNCTPAGVRTWTCPDTVQQTLAPSFDHPRNAAPDATECLAAWLAGSHWTPASAFEPVAARRELLDLFL